MRLNNCATRLNLAGVTSLCALLPLVCILTEAPAVFAQEEEPASPAEVEPAKSGPTESADASGAEEPTAADADVAVGADDADDAVDAVDATASAAGDSSGGLFESSLDSSATLGGGESSDLSLDLGGYVRSDAYIGVIPGTVPLEPAARAVYGELAIQTTARAGDVGDAFAELRLRYGQQLDERALFVDLREAYVNTYLGPFDIRLGKQIVVWGRADAFNPTNNVTPTNFRIRSPHEDDKRVGNVGARVYLNLLPVRLEGIWMPLYEPTLLPSLTVESPDIVKFTEGNFPSLSLRNGTYAAKAHLLLSSVEASVSYLYGDAPLPGYDLGYVQGGVSVPGQPGVRADTQVNIVPTSYNQHVVGADFSTAVGDLFGVRGEAAFRSPINYDTRTYAPNPDLQYVLGLDREFGSLNIIAQYMGRYTFDWKKWDAPAGSIDDLVNQTNPVSPLVTSQLTSLLLNRNQILFGQLAELQHLATVRLEWLGLHETLSLSAVGMMNFTTSEWLLQPKVSYKFTSDLSATVGGEIYAGPDDTLFGWIDESLSSGYVELKLNF